MFTHALTFGILYGNPLGEWRKMCHLQYAEDLLIMTARGNEGLRIIKLILCHSEGMSRLVINPQKTCLFSTRVRQLPDESSATTLGFSLRTLPLEYLEILISGLSAKPDPNLDLGCG